MNDSIGILKQLKDQKKDYFDKWETMRKHYEKVINNAAIAQSVAFTPHNYDNHCVGIYKILSYVLIKSYSSIPNGNTLNENELFVLCTAVLFHDIYMSYDSNKRLTHSKLAREWILKEYENENSVIKSNIPATELIEAIADIMYGHSDIKKISKTTGKEEIEIDTIDELIKKYDETPLSYDDKVISTVFLAALLRIADELDIQESRISGFDYTLRNIPESSKSHWEKCSLFKQPKLSNTNNSVISLCLNENKISYADDQQKVIELLLDVEKKINKELTQLYNNVFKVSTLTEGKWVLKKAELHSTNEKLIKSIRDIQLNNPLSITDDSSSHSDKVSIEDNIQLDAKKKELNPNSSSDVEGIKLDYILDDYYSEKIRKRVIDRNLFKSGHFLVNESMSSRDWIDILPFFEDSDLFNGIMEIILNSKNFNMDSNKYLFIGISFGGNLLASYLGFITNNPFTYYIHEKNAKKYGSHEVQLGDFNTESKIVVFSDVIVTGKTIQSLADILSKEYKISEDSIDSIFSVFLRKMSNCESFMPSLKSSLREKVKVLNDDFGIEMCTKKQLECLFVKYKKNQYTNMPKE